MRNIVLFILFLPFTLSSQDLKVPFVRFDQGSILFYLPSQSAYAPLLPAYKPGFVHILRIPCFQSQSNQEISDHLSSGIRDLASSVMNVTQKEDFLEQYACLILLNYMRVVKLDTLFLRKTNDLKNDIHPDIRGNAALVGKLFEMYREVGKR